MDNRNPEIHLTIEEKAWLFPKTTSEAINAQREMASKVISSDTFTDIHTIAGVDVSNTPRDPENIIYGVSVLLSFPQYTVIETTSSFEKARFPYIPGLLGFREAPSLIQAIQKLKKKPDLIMIDGHGISHPRGLGIASHIGVLLNIPTIGVAKTPLVGKPLHDLGEDVGSQTPLVWHGKPIAMLLKTKKRSNPLIISVGHKVSLETAVDIVRRSLKGFKLPEPTRYAHNYANEIRKSSSE